MSPKHAAVNFIFFQEWPAASLKKENIDWFLSDRVATVGKKSFPGIYVTTEAVTPHGEWSGSATAWWEAVWSIRISYQGHWILHAEQNSVKKITKPATPFGSWLSQKAYVHLWVIS